MSEVKIGFVGTISKVVKSPREGFSRIEEGDLSKGLVLILFLVVFSAWSSMNYASKMEFNLVAQGFDMEQLRSSMLPFYALGGAIGSIIRWLIPSVLLVVMAKIMVGGGSSKRMLAMTEFATIPLIAQQLLRVADSYVISVAEVAAIRALTPLGNVPLGLLNNILSVFNFFGLLTLFLTIHAVSINYGVKTMKAFKVALSAYIVYLALISLPLFLL
jgi:hypothetical protein